MHSTRGLEARIAEARRRLRSSDMGSRACSTRPGAGGGRGGRDGPAPHLACGRSLRLGTSARSQLDPPLCPAAAARRRVRVRSPGTCYHSARQAGGRERNERRPRRRWRSGGSAAAAAAAWHTARRLAGPVKQTHRRANESAEGARVGAPRASSADAGAGAGPAVERAPAAAHTWSNHPASSKLDFSFTSDRLRGIGSLRLTWQCQGWGRSSATRRSSVRRAEQPPTQQRMT